MSVCVSKMSSGCMGRTSASIVLENNYSPGIAIDMRTATLTGVSGVVLGWKYSAFIMFRLVTTIHSSLPYLS